VKVSVAELRSLVRAALERAGANPTMADATARALVLAESQGTRRT
jgi:LDH2 family malate/lactate/ureidoglycolate dehydrogenase